MLKLRHLYLSLLAIAGASVPALAYSGYYAPRCGLSLVWTFTGYHYQLVCF
jgi:hypothetical protein